MEPREAMSRYIDLLAQLDVAYERIAKAHGLTYNALLMLYLAEEDDRLTQKRVCDALRLPKSSVHSMLADLVRRGILELVDGRNKKEKVIAFTPEGTAFMETVDAETDRIENAAVTAVSEDELLRLLETTEKLVRGMAETAQALYGGGDGAA